MERGNQQPPLWLLPTSSVELPSLRRRHAVATYVLLSLALVALVPAFLLAPEPIWVPHDAFTILLAAGFACAAAATSVRRVVLADSTTVPALIGIVLFGPLPAACIFAAGEIINLLREPKSDQPLLALLVNINLSGWSCVVAALWLNATGFAPPVDSQPLLYLAVFGAGLLMVAVDAVLLMTVSVLYDDVDSRTLFRSVMKTVLLPDIGMAAISAGILFAYFELGIAGLIVPLVGVVMLPRAVVRLLDRPPLNQLDVSEATIQYAALLGGALGATREDRRVLRDAAAQIGGRPELNRSEDFLDVMQAVLYAGERWDGEAGGFPGTLCGKDIPLTSRILAVALLWATLTAKDTPELSPSEALVELRARAGAELDPTVVAAAVKVVEDEFSPRATAEPAVVAAS